VTQITEDTKKRWQTHGLGLPPFRAYNKL
jgi:hypothetical protein